MHSLRTPRRWPAACLFAAATLVFAGCQATDSIHTQSEVRVPGASTADVVPLAVGNVVISQVYGGGGNAGSKYTNDFIELYNPTTSDVTLTGASVQYGSATGTGAWQATALTGVIQAGHYYLVQESQGTGGTTPLPTPDASATIAMSATAGKVALVNSTTVLNGVCPTVNVIDEVGFGPTSNCAEGGHPTPILSNTTAALRKNNGATDTNDNAADFTVGDPAPRNSGAGQGGAVTTVTVTPTPTTVTVNGTRALTATGKDANGVTSTTTFTWASSDPATASVDASGVVTGHIIGGPVTITATSANNVSGTASVTVQAPPSNVTVSGRSTPLPVGFQTQLFASGTDNSGNPVTTVTWSTSDPTIVTVDQNGIISASGVGSAQITATTPDNTAGHTTITTETVLLSSGARAGHNVEFGTPFDNDASNDIIVARKEYTLSYNPARGGPNWVSWNMDASHLGSLDRCNCFTQDTTLIRMGYPAYNTNDYIAGGLWDRGHMEPSADQTTTDGENAYTFMLSNTLPQKHDLNAGPWEDLENALRDSAKAVGGREIYTIAGGIFTNGVGLGTLNNGGKIGIPDSTWKIAIIMPAGTGLGDVHSAADVHVIAVNMPNVVGIASNKFPQYLTTIAKIEASTGYNFLSLIPEGIQCKIEVRNCVPTPVLVSANGSTTVAAGTQLVLNVSGADADGADGPWKLSLDFGDGSAPYTSTLFTLPTDAHPLARGKTWSTPGTYTVRLTITDKKGGQGVTTLQVTVQ